MAGGARGTRALRLVWILAMLGLVDGTEPQCKDAMVTALVRNTAGDEGKCAALRDYALCVTRLGLSDAAETLYIDNAVVLIEAECALPPEIVAKDGNLDIAVDGTGQVTFTRRTRSTIDLWDLNTRVNAAATTTDVDSKISTQAAAINADVDKSLTQNLNACTNQATTALTGCGDKANTAVTTCQTAVSQGRTYTDNKVADLDLSATAKLSTAVSSLRTQVG